VRLAQAAKAVGPRVQPKCDGALLIECGHTPFWWGFNSLALHVCRPYGASAGGSTR
jgi:hypothetical protein